ncbi:MAG: tRNA pseudouridine(38-40) synthase TruA [Oscillospiraceae bacterium]|nr:tRNA pseudouridine(38-40) synthase TruA [Oscillospiraceae bacterium]
MTLCYDGTRYRGWQRLPNGALTVQGKVEEALSEIFGMLIEVSGSGRTDAGVHAWGQVASFHAPEQPIETIVPKLRHLLPEDIGVVALSYAPDRFHARLSATRKTYRYRLWNSAAPDVFERRFRTQILQPLDVAKMREAAKLLEGTHDFLGFCANKHFKKSSVRTLYALAVEQDGNEIRFTLTADGFLYHMARILVGTLLEIGGGKRETASIAEIFDKKDRALAGETAPAKGLCLMEVRYE